MSTLDYYKQAQAYYSKSPTIILGSGASSAFGMSGMWQLSEYLKNNIDDRTFDGDDWTKWSEFVALLDAGADLESALHAVEMSDR